MATGDNELWGFLVPQADPDEIDALASTLENANTAIGEVNQQISGGLGEPMSLKWFGQAASAYRTAANEAASSVTAVANDLSPASSALKAFAATLRTCLSTQTDLQAKQEHWEGELAAAGANVADVIKAAKKHGDNLVPGLGILTGPDNVTHAVLQAQIRVQHAEGQLAGVQQAAEQNYENYDKAVIQLCSVLAPATGWAAFAADMGKLAQVASEVSAVALLVPGADAVVAAMDTIALASEVGETTADEELLSEGKISSREMLDALEQTSMDGVLEVAGMSAGDLSYTQNLVEGEAAHIVSNTNAYLLDPDGEE